MRRNSNLQFGVRFSCLTDEFSPRGRCCWLIIANDHHADVDETYNDAVYAAADDDSNGDDNVVSRCAKLYLLKEC